MTTTRDRRIQLGKDLFAQFGGVVRHGPFAGMTLSQTSSWTPSDLCPKLLGTYEIETIGAIGGFLAPSKTLINVGAGDGFFTIGFARSGLCGHVLAFELNPDGRRIIQDMAATNSVADRVTIFGAAGDDFIANLREAGVPLGECVALIDIEGGEYALLTTETLVALSRTPLVVELHAGLVPDGVPMENELMTRLKRVYDVTIIRTGARRFDRFADLAALSDDDRWLMASEGRPYAMEWAVCTPRAEASPR